MVIVLVDTMFVGCNVFGGDLSILGDEVVVGGAKGAG